MDAVSIPASCLSLANHPLSEAQFYGPGYYVAMLLLLPRSTFIRQLWMDDDSYLSSQKGIQYIDSRHLYLNHFDPLETPVTIFYRKIGNRKRGMSQRSAERFAPGTTGP